MADPTERQKRFLENRGISVPATKAACSTLIGYVKEGNGVGRAHNESERIATLKAAQRRWERKRVGRKGYPDDQGTVRYLLAYRAGEVHNTIEAWEEVGSTVDRLSLLPFQALV